MENEKLIIEKLESIEEQLKIIRKYQEDNTFEKNVFRNWASFYSLSLAADIITGQTQPPSKFL